MTTMALSDKLVRLTARPARRRIGIRGWVRPDGGGEGRDRGGSPAQAQADTLSASVDEHEAEVSEWWATCSAPGASTPPPYATTSTRCGRRRFKTPQRNAEQAEADASSCRLHVRGSRGGRVHGAQCRVAHRDADEMAQA